MAAFDACGPSRQVAIGPERVTTLMTTSSRIIDLRWLSDCTVLCCASSRSRPGPRQRCFTASRIGQIAFFTPRVLHQTVSADNFHDPFQGVGEHIQAHLRVHTGQLSGQEVRRTHPLIESPERMLNRFRALIISRASLSQNCISSKTASCSQRSIRRVRSQDHPPEYR